MIIGMVNALSFITPPNGHTHVFRCITVYLIGIVYNFQDLFMDI